MLSVPIFVQSFETVTRRKGLEPAGLMIEVTEIIVHEGDGPFQSVTPDTPGAPVLPMSPE